MMYLIGYLGAGVLALIVMLGAHRLQKKDGLHELLAQMEADRLARQTRFMQFVEISVVPLVAGVAVVVSWPVALCIATKGAIANFMRRKTENPAELEAHSVFDFSREFAVGRQHLQEELTVQAVEARECVTDPLLAVPDVPFGHLNSAWQAFLGGLPEGGALWSFAAQWKDPWNDLELRCGYVWVKDDTPGAYFLTLRKGLPPDEALA